jgi:DNA (cytosine-5)-methyltransferase 1
MVLKHGSLFSGIGGFDLAAEWMGWENVFHCEWNEFGQKILKYYWPNAISYGDITQTDFTIHRGNIDILTGGFPCQPYSQAGKRLGKEDDRHLWPEMLRAIQEIQPKYIVGENVLGIVNWNGGLVFDEVQADMENEGYEVIPVVLPACAKNAPHKRERVWFVAYRSDAGTKSMRQERENSVYGFKPSANSKPTGLERKNRKWMENTIQPAKQVISNPKSDNKQHGRVCPERNKKQIGRCNSNASWENFPTKPAVCGGNDGLPYELDGITFPKWRNESLKAYGNAIVPQVAHELFKAISKAGSAGQKKQ